MSIQLVCDVNKCFQALHVGLPGSVHASRVFQHLNIYKNPEQFFENHYLLDYSSYSSSNHIIPAYKGSLNQNNDQRKFNYCLAQSQVHIEHAIGMLKGRWSSLQQMQFQMKGPEDIQNFVNWVVTCVILHNILVKIDDQWLTLYDDEDPPELQVINEGPHVGMGPNIWEKIKSSTLDWYNNKS
ncbi:hypothetical protein O181_108428 [Austropuccinia psidii MF-1]|uniref:DDE Tnp4 domain-containing protein n=1 Tax=Austropuccinia psidii MF-1 TaxID=1389203 RepID=A0A9Q3PNU6_9BASI|nr:hypothetical protein [Austropuccinia psidii MF-1]